MNPENMSRIGSIAGALPTSCAIRALVALGALLATCQTTLAQERFQRYFDQSSNDRAVWAQPRPGDGHYMASIRDATGTPQTIVWRLNNAGAPIWARWVSMDVATQVIPVTVPGVSGGALVVGGRDVVALSDTGTFQWARRFTPPVGDAFTRGPSVDEYYFASGGFIIAGEAQSRPVLRRLGPTGGVWFAEMLKNSSVVDPFYPDPPGAFNDVATLPDGFVAVGWLLVPTGSGFATRQTLVARFGLGGAITWAKTYRQGQYNAAWGVDIAANGDYLVCGYTKDAAEGGGTYLMRLKPNGDPSAQFPVCQRWFTGFHGTRSLEELANGQILLGGTADSGSTPYLGALRTSSSGAMIDCLNFGGPVTPLPFEQGVSAMPTADGGFIALGDTTSFAIAGGRNLYLIRQSSQGAVPGSGCYEGAVVPLEDADVFCDIHNEVFEIIAEPNEAFAVTSRASVFTGGVWCSNACPGDFDGNAVVNGGDLGALLAAWGPVAPGTGGDIDGDGVVNGADLGALLANWGSCEG